MLALGVGYDGVFSEIMVCHLDFSKAIDYSFCIITVKHRNFSKPVIPMTLDWFEGLKEIMSYKIGV
jgi:hypothetical protein